MVNIRPLSFKSIQSSIVMKLEASSRQERVKMEYKVDMGCDGNFMPIDIFKILLPMATMEQLENIKTKVSYCTHTNI